MNPISITRNHILHIYKPVTKTAHKGTQGHALLIGGSYGKMGSICLSSKAALRSGCGLVTAYVPKCGIEVLQISVPEAMVLVDKKDKHISSIRFKIIPNAIGIGPGLGIKKRTERTFFKFLQRNKIPLVVDADALNILSKNKQWLELLPKGTIITPHLKELARLVGEWESEEQRMKLALELSAKYQVVVVMKGAPTYIILENKIYKNTTGNQAMATAGSGDVLTGIITSLLAQGYSSLNAAKLGVFLHGLTADIALPRTGFESFIASDIIEQLALAFISISKK